MSLYEKIKKIYPELVISDFEKTIILEDDGTGEKIAEWNHTTLARPTDAQLNNE